MDLVIKPLDESSVDAAVALDDSFLVDSELILHAERGVIHFEVTMVSPSYWKSYADQGQSDFERAPDREVYLAWLGDQVVGRLILSEGWNRFAWVEDLVVDRASRRLGIARALLDRALQWASARHLPGLRLETQHNNVGACQLYQSYGFRLEGFDRNLYRGIDGAKAEIALYWYYLTEVND